MRLGRSYQSMVHLGGLDTGDSPEPAISPMSQGSLEPPNRIFVGVQQSTATVLR